MPNARKIVIENKNFGRFLLGLENNGAACNGCVTSIETFRKHDFESSLSHKSLLDHVKAE